MFDWDQLFVECLNCKKCVLGATRKNIVFGRGNRNAPMLLVGEGPGEQEDIKGQPFVGAAGQLLELLLDALEFTEEDYYIANIVKCRPPSNRIPTDDEACSCLPFLRNQVFLIKPRIIVCMGSTAFRHIGDKDAKISHVRGQWIERKGYFIMPTFHPAALLRDESKKILMWEDFKKVKVKLGEVCQNQS